MPSNMERLSQTAIAGVIAAVKRHRVVAALVLLVPSLLWAWQLIGYADVVSAWMRANVLLTVALTAVGSIVCLVLLAILFGIEHQKALERERELREEFHRSLVAHQSILTGAARKLSVAILYGEQLRNYEVEAAAVLAAYEGFRKFPVQTAGDKDQESYLIRFRDPARDLRLLLDHAEVDPAPLNRRVEEDELA